MRPRETFLALGLTLVAKAAEGELPRDLKTTERFMAFCDQHRDGLLRRVLRGPIYDSQSGPAAAAIVAMYTTVNAEQFEEDFRRVYGEELDQKKDPEVARLEKELRRFNSELDKQFPADWEKKWFNDQGMPVSMTVCAGAADQREVTCVASGFDDDGKPIYPEEFRRDFAVVLLAEFVRMYRTRASFYEEPVSFSAIALKTMPTKLREKWEACYTDCNCAPGRLQHTPTKWDGPADELDEDQRPVDLKDMEDVPAPFKEHLKHA